MSKFKSAICILFVPVFFISSPLAVRAYQVEKIADMPVSGDFVLHQTKTEARLDAGASATRSISLTNRSGADLAVAVSVEDFSAATKADQNIDLLGAQSGLYSLKDYLKPETTSFTLRHGERITLPVVIAIPTNAQPGGLYGAVIFSAQTAASAAAGSANIRVIPRLASLFFVRVNGEATESGALLDFSSSKTFYWGAPVDFEFNYKNSGNVYLNPYGELKVADVFGREVYNKWISPYFVLPGAIRQQKEILDRPSLWGIYQATLRLNRGYGNQIDQKSVYFFVLPIRMIVIALIILAALAGLAWRIRSAFKKPKIK